MILGVIVLTVVTQMSDGRAATQETVQPNMEECHRLAEIVNKTNGAGKYKFSASCRQDEQRDLAKVE